MTVESLELYLRNVQGDELQTRVVKVLQAFSSRDFQLQSSEICSAKLFQSLNVDVALVIVTA
jgi:hypothetical protein